MEQNEVQKFFEGLPNEAKQEQDIFDDKKKPTEQVAGEEPSQQKPDEEESPRKNRAYRRLEEKLQRERESNIALAERLKTLSETTQPSGEKIDMPAEWLALYGDTPESQRAWQAQEKIFRNFGEQVKQDTINELESRRQQEALLEKEEGDFIDSQLEALEDEYNIDLTSNAPRAQKARTEFLEMVESLSPKDENGLIREYADFGSTFELYQKKSQKQTPSRNKEIAARSMHKSGQEVSQATNITPGFRGWQKDYGINE